MANLMPSIYNDVLGPIMRGPSSSHVGGAYRIAALIRNAHGAEQMKNVVCEFDTYGTQAATHIGHGSDLGFLCGILGMDLTDKRVPEIFEIAKTSVPSVEFRVIPMKEKDPTLHRVTVTEKDGSTHVWDGITSMGGGMVEITSYDGFRVLFSGDYYELLLKVPASGREKVASAVEKAFSPDWLSVDEKEDLALIEVRKSSAYDKAELEMLLAKILPIEYRLIDPVLPTLAKRDMKVPFVTAEETMEYLKDHPMLFSDAAALYESERGGTTPEEAREKMRAIMRIMKGGVAEGLAGTEYEDRILGPQSHLIAEAEQKKKLVPDPVINRIVESVTAVMEVKSSYGVFVASPTGGSCGCLPGTLVGIAKSLDLDDETLTNGLLAAGLIGVYISRFSSFGSDVGACAAECGSAGAMAAAGIVEMMGGTPEQCIDAAALALHGITGLGCDPIAGRVEVPCLEKNIMCGVNALACANMALAGYDKVVPFDESIRAIANISEILPIELRCSLECGLSVGCTSQRLEKKLAEIGK